MRWPIHPLAACLMKGIASRFREFLPVVVDVETGGLNPQTDALLEMAAISLTLDDQGQLILDQEYHYHIVPFTGARIVPEALAINKIDPFHPFRFAVSEQEVLQDFLPKIKQECKQKKCQRAVLVGHNAWFDLHFLKAAIKRCGINKYPFHPFTSFDTATLSAAKYGHTVLATALQKANLSYSQNSAHSALYDTQRTAELFCKIINEM